MPAIASLEDLKIAQRDFRSMFLVVSPYDLRFTPYGLKYTMLSALCSMLYGNGGESVGRMSVSYGSKNAPQKN